MDRRMDGQKDVWKLTLVLQDSGPLWPLPKNKNKMIKNQVEWRKEVIDTKREAVEKKQVAQRQYVVSDTRCPAMHDCELE